MWACRHKCNLRRGCNARLRSIDWPCRFAEKHRKLLNALLRQHPSLLEGTLAPLLRAARLVDFDNKRAYFRTKVRTHSTERHYGSLKINVRREHVFEDSFHQLRIRHGALQVLLRAIASERQMQLPVAVAVDFAGCRSSGLLSIICEEQDLLVRGCASHSVGLLLLAHAAVNLLE